MSLKDYCKAGHLVVLSDGLRCLLIPNYEGLQLVALGGDFKERHGYFDTGKKDYIWMASLHDFDEDLRSVTADKSLLSRIDKIYGLGKCGRFWQEDKDRALLWERRDQNENRPKDLATNRGE